MKILNKIQINPQKLIGNEELLKLKGGDLTTCEVVEGVQGIPCFCSANPGEMGYYVGCFASQDECLSRCMYIWGY